MTIHFKNLEKPGDNLVDVPILCIITRFQLRSVRYLLPTYIGYLKVIKQTKLTGNSGLLRSAFLIENLRICYSFSIWSIWEDIPCFGSKVTKHVEAARKVFDNTFFRSDRGPEIWSTK
jgi:hypothetical protein